MREVGYSKNTSLQPYKITRGKTYQKLTRPLLDGLQEEINAIKNAMALKDKNEEEYRVLAYSMDILTKNYQLLSGGATERQVFVLPSEVITRNAIVTSQPSQDVNTVNGSVKPRLKK